MRLNNLIKPAAVASVFLVASSQAFSALTYDLRITQVNGVNYAGDAKSISANLNDVLTLSVFAVVTGANAAGFQGVQQAFFAITSGTGIGTTQGVFGAGTVAPAFSFGAFSGGTPQDTNLDTFNDRLGIQAASQAVEGGNPSDVVARANAAVNYSTAGATKEYLLVTAPFTIRLIGTNGQVNVSPALFASGIGAARFSATWAEDAATTATAANRNSGFNSLAATAPNTGVIAVGPAITLLGVPEPSAFGMVMLGALSMVGFRRFGLRRAS